MNFWTGLILGIIIGWLVEWLIDWLFWRRDAQDLDEREATADQMALLESEGAGREADWQSRLAAAEADYQERLAAVEGEWQSRLNLNEQQWHDHFRTLETDNETLRGRLADLMAGATLAAAGAKEAAEPGPDTAPAPDGGLEIDAFDALGDPDVPHLTFDAPAAAGEWEAEGLALDTGGLAGLDDVALQPGAQTPQVDWFEPVGSEVVVETPTVADDALAEVFAEPVADMADEGLEMGDVPVEEVSHEDVGYPDAAAVLATEGGAVIESSAGAIAPAHVDDLTRIRGIGPKFAVTLAEGGIHTFEELAASSPDQLQALIQPPAWRQIQFDLWITQAAGLAATRHVATGDNLTDLEGLGAAYATRLREAGITTFAQLAASDVATLAAICRAPAMRVPDYAAWIAAAEAAVRRSA